jgi:hypothetical protein
MKIQKLSDQNVKNKKLPTLAVVIQLLDKDDNHLAFIACCHEKIFGLYDSENDYETSNFLEEISNFEAEILQNYFRFENKLEQKFCRTGEFIITDKHGKIFYHERPA